MERRQLQRFHGPPLQFPDHDLAAGGLHHHAVAAADRRMRRHHDNVAIAVGRLQRIAGNFQRESVLFSCGGQRHLAPAFAGGIAVLVEMAGARRLRETQQRHRMATSRSVADQLHEGIDRVAAGGERFCQRFGESQRSRPSGVMRLDLLKVVGSRPERRASPEGDSPARSASRSSAAQTWPWVSTRGVFACLAMRNPVPARNYIRNRNPPQRSATAALEVRPRRRYGRRRLRTVSEKSQETQRQAGNAGSVRRIYKICPASAWREAERQGVYRGSVDDARDGFIHFSTAAQVAETARKHYFGQRALFL